MVVSLTSSAALKLDSSSIRTPRWQWRFLWRFRIINSLVVKCRLRFSTNKFFTQEHKSVKKSARMNVIFHGTVYTAKRRYGRKHCNVITILSSSRR